MSAALDFLGRLHPDAPSTLVVFKPRTEGATLDKGDAAEWIAARDGVSDIYVLVGLPEGSPTTTPTKERMRGSAWLWCDLDPRPRDDLGQERERVRRLLTERLPDGVPPPTIVVDSGRGMWALWQLDEPCLDPTRVEECNLWLANQLGADKCHNINRVTRLAGTVNLKTGQRSAIVLDEPGRVYSIDQFPRAGLTEPPRLPPVGGDAGGGEVVGPAVRVTDLAELDEWGVGDRTKVIIAQGRHPDGPPKEGDDSRSAWLFDACCNMVRAGVPDEVVLGVITDPDWGISASVLDKGRGAERYARKQVVDARAMVAKDEAEFQTDEKGVPYKSQHNIRVALHKLGARLAYDEFADRLVVNGEVLQDEDVAALYLETDARFGFRPAKDFFWMVVEDEARRHAYHPVRDYLDGLAWDGEPRIDTWLIDHGGAEDTEYVRAVGSLVLKAAVRRARKPGCKFDEMLVLHSAQGAFKSTALQALCPNPDWFSDDLPLGTDTKVAMERLAGRWIVEAAELKGMRRGEVEHIKSFLSRQVDRARLAYGRIASEAPRQCIIVGTTNSERFLKDTTGNRRFWPVKVGWFDVPSLRRERDQLWAEADHREAAGESIRLDPSLYEAARDAQEEHRVEDPFVVELQRVLGNLEGKLLAADAWEIIGVPPGQRTQDHNQRLGEALRELGWERTKRRFGGVQPTWCYVRGDGRNPLVVRRDAEGRVTVEPEPPF